MSFCAKLATRYDQGRLPRWLQRLITMNAVVVGDVVLIRYYLCGFTFYKEIF